MCRVPLKGSEELHQAIEEWENEGLLSQASSNILRERYPIGSAAWYRNSSFVLTIIAGLLFTAGLVLFISYNWHTLGIPLRVSIGLMPWILASIATIHAQRNGKQRPAEVWGFFATLLYGVNIFLQGQIFHLSGYWPTAVFWWAVGAILLTTVQRSTLALTLSLVLSIVWLWSETVLGNMPPAIFGIVPLLFVLSWRKPSRLALVGSIIIGLLASVNLWHGWTDDLAKSSFVYLPWCAIATLIALRYPVQQESFRRKLLWICAAGALLLSRSLNSWQHDDVINVTHLAVGIACSLIVCSAILLSDRSLRSLGVTALTTWVSLWYTVVYRFWDGGLVIGTDLITLAFAVLLIHSGVRTKDKPNFMAGVFTLTFLAWAKYLDFAGDYLVGSLVFGLVGLVLFLANEYWKRRYATS
jgi:uncharacterized membrane protein